MKKGLIVKCKICEKEIYIPQYRIGRTKFCSFQCKNKNTSLHPIKPKTGRFVECFICKKKVWKYKSRECFKKTFCSRECFRKFDYGGKVELKCKFCGKIYFNYKSQIKWHGSSYCGLKCYKNMKKTKHISIKKDNSSLKKQLWLYFSKYIRQRDKGICISCGKIDDWKNTDAGHYIPKTAGLSIYFDERNVNCQCTGCNRFRHGNLHMYAIALKKRYGNNILEELEELRKQKVLYSNIEYKKKIDIYKNKLKDNNFEFGTGKIIKS